MISGGSAASPTTSKLGLTNPGTIKLRDYSRAQIDGLLLSHLTAGNGATVMELWAVRSAGVYTRRTDHVGRYLTSLSAIAANAGGADGADMNGCIAISPDIVVAANHTHYAETGDTYKFVSEDGLNNIHTRTISDFRAIPGTDINVGKLSVALPSDIIPMKLVGPANWQTTYFNRAITADDGFAYQFPLYTINRSHVVKILVYPVISTEVNAWGSNYVVFQDPQTEVVSGVTPRYSNYGYAPGSGDSGNPLCLVIDNELCLVSLFWTVIVGPAYSSFLTSITTAITQMGGQQYTQKAVSGFPAL